MCVIAIDYDKTITANFDKARLAIDTLRLKGHYIVIWSSRNNILQHGTEQRKLFADMLDKLKQHNIAYDDIDYGNCGKYHAQVYIDDKCIRFENNWDEVIRQIY